MNTESLGLQACACIVILGILLGTILPSLFTVEDDELCVYSYDLDPDYGTQDEVFSEGLYFRVYPRTIKCLKRTVQDIDLQNDPVVCLTKDGIEIELSLKIQHQRPVNNTLTIFKAFGQESRHDRYLYLTARYIIRNVCSKHDVGEFYTNREAIQTDMLDSLTSIQTSFGIETNILLLQLINVKLPEDVSTAIEQVQEAQQSINKALEERESSITVAEEALAIALENASIKSIQANAIREALMQEGLQKESILVTQWQARIDAFANIQSSLNMTGSEFVNVYLRNEALKQSTKVTLSV